MELVDLLRRDRELGEGSRMNAEHFAPSVPKARSYDLRNFEEEVPTPQLAAGTVRLSRRSNLKLALGCLAAFAGGFALTTPLWW